MRSRLFSHAVAALGGAIGGVLLWAAITDIGWTRYRYFALHLLTNPPFPTTDSQPPEKPVSIDREVREVCDPLRRASGLDYVELGMARDMLDERAFDHLHDEALSRSWDEIGVIGHVRVALFGLSDADRLAVEAVAYVPEDPGLQKSKRVRERFAEALRPCAMRAFHLSLQR